MWTKMIFGTDLYHIVSAFCIYSMMGWLVESMYMSFCNRKLTNRGFAKGPFCPIYGFGALFGSWILSPFEGNYFALYCVGALLATIFEYIVGVLMIKIFGELWWDYNEKLCNFKGIICLESTLAWGVYAIIVVHFLSDWVIHFIDRYPFARGVQILHVFLFIFTIDMLVHLLHAFGTSLKEQREKFVDKIFEFKARWY